MKNKDSTVKTKYLHPRLQKTLPPLDALHQELTGKELVITSAQDGAHSKNSLHYSGRAYDFRRWYFDNLDDKKKELFIAGLDTIFLKKYFDVVLEGDHWHVEWDPKPVKDVPEPRIKKPCPGLPLGREITPTELKTPKMKVRFWRKDWFKNSWKFGLNVASQKIAGVRIFTKSDKITQKTQSLKNWLIRLIKIIIKKFGGTK